MGVMASYDRSKFTEIVGRTRSPPANTHFGFRKTTNQKRSSANIAPESRSVCVGGHYIVSTSTLIFQLPRSSTHIYSKRDYMSTFEYDAVSQTGASTNSRSARLTLKRSSAAQWQLQWVSFSCCYVKAGILSIQVGCRGVFFWVRCSLDTLVILMFGR